LTDPPVLASSSGPLYTITLNRPHRLNAVTAELYRAVLKEMDQAEADPGTRVIILAGAGRAFCVGADLKEHASGSRTKEEQREYADLARNVCTRLQVSPRPVVCLVRGYAFGAGAEIALSCDFVFMEDSAVIGFPEISIGTYIGGGLSFILPRIVGMAKARELLFLGERLTGTEARAAGLIHRSAPAAEFEAVATDLTSRLAAVAPIPLSIMKRQLRAATWGDPEQAMKDEVDALLQCMGTEDWAEGVKAFAEKRTPVFKGR